nr:hypothetical protein [Dawidia cretensis]
MEGGCRYNGKSIINYKPNDETYFWGLLEDKNENIWPGGRNKGVFRYDGKIFTSILQKADLIHHMLRALQYRTKQEISGLALRLAILQKEKAKEACGVTMEKPL